MRRRDVEQFRKILEDRLVALYNATHHIVRGGMERHMFDQDEPRDEGDEAQRVAVRDASMTLGERDAALAQQIEEALRRITRGEYGKCVDCGGDIELQRLRTVPWALRCSADQQALESERRERPPTL